MVNELRVNSGAIAKHLAVGPPIKVRPGAEQSALAYWFVAAKVTVEAWALIASMAMMAARV